MKKIILIIGITLAHFQFSNAQETKTIPSSAQEKNEEDDIIFLIVEDMPSYPGGMEEMTKYLQKNLKYPEVYQKNGITGTVIVNFVIETDGSVSNVKVLRGIGTEMDEEAKRVVEAMPKWTPGKQRGEAVRVSYNLPIRYQLNDPAPEKKKK